MIDTGRLQTDEKDFTIYADCFGLSKDFTERISKPRWGELKPEIEEQMNFSDSSDEEMNVEEDI